MSHAFRLPRWLARAIYRLNLLRLWLARPLTVGVRLVMVRHGQVLLIRHTYHDGWLLPGGGVKKGETLEAAARREACEEIGADLGELRLLGAFSNFFEYKSDHVIVLVCEDFSLDSEKGRAVRDWEIDCVDFFPLDALPADLLPGHRRRIKEYCQSDCPVGIRMW